MEIVLATRNEGKVKEFRKLLEGESINIISLNSIPSAPIVKESGSSFQENALMKAEAVASFTKRITIADDSGLEVDVLQGQPGIHSARFAGKNANDQENNTKLLRQLEGVPISKRGAVFRCVIAIVSPEGKKCVVEGECNGIILCKEKGKLGFGYDPVFLIPRYGKTFAEIPPEVKNRISHRAKAIENLKMILKEFF